MTPFVALLHYTVTPSGEGLTGHGPSQDSCTSHNSNSSKALMELHDPKSSPCRSA